MSQESGGYAWFSNDQDQIIILYNGRMVTVNAGARKQSEIRSLLKRGLYARAVDLADRAQQAARFLAEVDGLRLEKDGNTLTLDGEEMPESMSRRVIAMLDDGVSAKPLVRFIQKLREHSDPGVREQLLDFLALNDFLIDVNGDIIAWKKVYVDAYGSLRDLWTKSLDYTPPRTVTMPRESVDNDPRKSCGAGLHFATWEFTQRYKGSVIVELRVDPRDVVSVPNSHRDKGRACTFHIERRLSPAEAMQRTPPMPDGAVAPGATNFRR